MKTLLFANWPQKIVAIVIAILLWQIVIRIEQPQQRKAFENVELSYVNTPQNMLITEGRTTIRVEATAVGPGLESLDGDSIRAIVDLSDARPGTSSYPVRLETPKDASRFIRLEPRPEEVEVTLEELRERVMQVEANYTGLPKGYDLGPISITPDRVRVFGAERVVDRASKAMVTIDLSDISPGEPTRWSVQVLDENDRPLEVTVDPPRVIFRATLAALPQRKNVLIQPTWSGSPEFGYRVVSYTLEPEQTRISGDAEVVASISVLQTEPIPLFGLKQDAVINVGIQAVPNIQVDVKQVRVSLKIVRDERNQPGE